VHQLREVVVQIVVSDPRLMIVTPVQRHIESKSQNTHPQRLSRQQPKAGTSESARRSRAYNNPTTTRPRQARGSATFRREIATAQRIALAKRRTTKTKL